MYVVKLVTLDLFFSKPCWRFTKNEEMCQDQIGQIIASNIFANGESIAMRLQLGTTVFTRINRNVLVCFLGNGKTPLYKELLKMIEIGTDCLYYTIYIYWLYYIRKLGQWYQDQIIYSNLNPLQLWKFAFP